MTANKIRFYIQSSYSFVDIAFDTADIGERGDVRIDQWLQRTQDLRHGLERIA